MVGAFVGVMIARLLIAGKPISSRNPLLRKGFTLSFPFKPNPGFSSLASGIEAV